MNVVEILMQMFRAMNLEEKKRVIVELGKDADVQAMQGAVAKAPSSGGARRGKKGSMPYWMKTATGLDPNNKGMFRVQGKWTKDPANEAVDTLVIIGAKVPKHYVLAKVTKNATDTVMFDSFGKKHVVACVKEISRSDNFSAIEKELCLRV